MTPPAGYATSFLLDPRVQEFSTFLYHDWQRGYFLHRWCALALLTSRRQGVVYAPLAHAFLPSACRRCCCSGWGQATLMGGDRPGNPLACHMLTHERTHTFRGDQAPFILYACLVLDIEDVTKIHPQVGVKGIICVCERVGVRVGRLGCGSARMGTGGQTGRG